MLDRILSRIRRARQKDWLRHEERREANATEPSAVFPASDDEVTIEAVYRAECDNQEGLRFVDFDGAYRLPAAETVSLGARSKLGMLARRSCLACHEEWDMHHRCPALGGRFNCC